MCFSTSASFIAGGCLSIIGIASLKKAHNRDKFIAAIPFIFGVQQILEGFQWMALNTQQVAMIPLYAYLFFASVFWPTYIPLTVLLLDKLRQKITRWFLTIDGYLSFYNLWMLSTKPTTAQIINHSIQYICGITTTSYSWLSGVYMLVTCGPFLISSNPMLRLLGIVS